MDTPVQCETLKCRLRDDDPVRLGTILLSTDMTFERDAARLIEIITDRRIGGLVLGLPRNMDGSEGPRCQSTRAFARNFDRLLPMPITFWDERLSTVAAEKALLEADTTRKRRAEVIDHVAAGYILQGILDRLAVIRKQGAAHGG